MIQQVASVTDVGTERGNFVIFPGLTASDLNLVIGADDPTNPRGPISGIQLIDRGQSEFAIIEIGVDEGAGTAMVTWETVPGGFYSIDASNDMANLTWLELEEAIEATGDTLSFTEVGLDFSATLRRFYRVRRVEVN